jgi:cell wall-associated NlpC family hydrolase
MNQVAAPSPPDPRRAAWRSDLADVRLKGQVRSARFVTHAAATVARPVLPVRKAPDAACGLETELLFGELVEVFERAKGWAWVQAVRDRYVGYVPEDGLATSMPPATHRIRALGTFVYARPDIKSPPVHGLSIGSRVSVLETRDRFAALANGGFVMHQHLATLDQGTHDFVDIAERFLATPYLWGGRSRLGVDCSGLLQLAMQAAGLDCPRDSDMQRAELGTALDVPAPLAQPDPQAADIDGLQRGDLLFWPGHVAIMTDAQTLLHANGHHMAVVVEPAIDAAVRIQRQTGEAVAAVRRPERLGRPTVS